MASTSTQRSFSSSTCHSQWSYDVFLSFRGEDTRRSFTDHLYSALIRCNIKTFRDDESLRKGEEIAPELIQAIAESRIAVIVFSENYADSKWCLEELVKIMSCKEEREQKVIPIFYHVDPSEVRNQKGNYEKAFSHHEVNADVEKKEKIRRWKNALNEAGNLAGYDVKVDSYESKIIDDIIEEIHGIVPKVLDLNDNTVGMDSRLEKLISLLKIQFNDVRMVGLYGLGGIGKTTIITALYNKISNRFQSISFLTNVREESTKDSGIRKLQQQLLDDTLGVKGQLTIKNILEGVKVIKDRLPSKKVLVFLDDIDDRRQLEHLVGNHSWFGHGSRIVITSRRKDLLARHGVDCMYEVDKLNDEEALQLFCSYAFKQHLPGKGYEDLSKQVVRYADGLPLALKVLGSLLLGKGLKDWKGELKKLEEVPNMEITNVLKISYDGLDHTQKRIFLDIACFFKGSQVETTTQVLDGSGFNAESGINALVDRCFITISTNKEIEMHDSLTQMGKEIVYNECANEPGERSRLWRHMDVCRVLTRNTGTEKIEGIVLNDESTPEQIKFTYEAFKRMTRLRVLIVNYKYMQLSEDFAFPSNDLTCLIWNGYPLASLPSNFHTNSLVYLYLSNNNIKRLWEDNWCLKNLWRMDLTGSQQLIEVPLFSTMPNLVDLILSECVSVESLPRDIDKCKHLRLLHCDGCSKLTSFPEIKRNIGKLSQLRLDETAIKELPSSFELLKDLVALNLKNCKDLESLSNCFCSLSSLRTINLGGCSKLGMLPKDLGRIPCLETLYLTSVSCGLPSLSGLSRLRKLCLDECNLTPGVIQRDNHLNVLEELSLRNCNLNEGVLNEIFHLCSLKVLDLSGCHPMEGEILVGINKLSNLRALGLRHCKKLSQIPELPSSLRLLDAHSSIMTSLPPMHSLVNCLKSANQDLEYKTSSDEVLLHDSMYVGQGICTVFHRSGGIPDWIMNQREVWYIDIKLPKVWYENNDFLGVAICCAYVPRDRYEGIPESDSAHESEIELDEFGEETLKESSDKDIVMFACKLYAGDIFKSPTGLSQDLHYLTFCKSYHYEDASEQMWVTMYLYPKVGLMQMYRSNQFTSLKGSFWCVPEKYKVLKCGFQPIYACQKEQTSDVISCIDCQTHVETQKLCLKGEPINQLRISAELESVAANIEILCLQDCKNLEILPTSLWDQLKSIKSLILSSCSRLRFFPQVLTNVESLRELHLDFTAIKELPPSIEHLYRLEFLDLTGCKELVTLPENICNLRFLQFLSVSYCLKLEKLPQNLGRLKSLKRLHAGGLNSRCFRSLSFSGLSSLKELALYDSKVMHGGVIMSDIGCLYSLHVLNLGHSTLDEGGIPSEIGRLSSLSQLNLNGNRFKSIPTWINQLSMLTVLDMNHCLGLVHIGELPSSLRKLNVHGCRLLEISTSLLTSSMFKCFESAVQNGNSTIDVFSSRSSGIPQLLRPQKKGSDEVVAKLPQDWYKDSDLLGFVLYATYDSVLDTEFWVGQEMDGNYFKCDLNLLGHGIQFLNQHRVEFDCHCSKVMWMQFYPKVLIQKKYRSNKWNQLKASFIGCAQGKALKVEECGIHLMYTFHAREHNPSGDQSMVAPIEWECQRDELKSLTPILSLGCPGFRKSFPETLEDVENLEKLHLYGTAIEELPASIQHLKGLQLLNLGYCYNLLSLPESICHLKSLTTLSCLSCSNLREFPEIRENMEDLIMLHLRESAVESLPSSMENLRGLQILNLTLCKNLRSLPSTICELKSLTKLLCSGCSQLRSFPDIFGDMGNLEWLYLDGTAIEELPESIEHLQGLQYLNLSGCNNLVRLPERIGYLKSLEAVSCSCCSNLMALPEMSENMEILRHLDLSGTSIKELPSSIEHLRGLQNLYLNNCSNLVSIPESICKLSSLKWLYVDSCTELEKFPSNLVSLQCLEGLGVSCPNLRVNCFSSIAADLNKLSMLRLLNMSHCIKLQRVPDLPPTLRTLDVHNCTPLETLSSLSRLLNFSLLKCFKSAIEELKCGSYWNNNKAIRVSTPGNNGIPERVRHREKGSEITVELPLDWHENDDLLGFAIYSVFVPLAPGSLSYKLNFCGDCDGSGCWDVDDFLFPCCQICAGSNQMCVSYYPKLAIEKHYWSNKWRHLKASFHGNDGIPVEVKECGFHLIYTEDIPEDTGTDDHRRRQDNDEQISCMHNWLELLSNYIQCISCGRF